MKAQQLVAWNVRKLRSKRGMSQEALATDAGVGRAYMSALERGQKNATLKLLDRIADALGAPLLELFATPKHGEKPPRVLPKGRKVKTLGPSGRRRTP